MLQVRVHVQNDWNKQVRAAWCDSDLLCLLASVSPAEETDEKSSSVKTFQTWTLARAETLNFGPKPELANGMAWKVGFSSMWVP